MVVFLGSYSGNARTTGKPFNRYTLALLEEREGVLTGRSYDYFTKEPLKDAEMLEFGDIVKAEFSTAELMGTRPELLSLSKVEESPYRGYEEFSAKS